MAIDKKENMQSLLGNTITVCALVSGFMLLFVAQMISDMGERILLTEGLCLFTATFFMNYFYRNMITTWALTATQVMAETGDDIVDGKLVDGRDFATFRLLWSFQPLLAQSWFILLVVLSLFGWSKNVWSVPIILAAFLCAFLIKVFLNIRLWRTTWAKYRFSDKAYLLGDTESGRKLEGRLKFYRWIYQSGEKKRE